MKRTEQEVLTAIRHITADKMMRRIVPRRALQSEIVDLLGMSKSEVYDTCVSLFKAKKIDGGVDDGNRWFVAIQLPEEIEQMNRIIL